MNRPTARIFSALVFMLASALRTAADQLLVLGDSLSKEYEITYPGVPAAGVEGIDPTHPAARNWCEVLHMQRNASFDLGIFRNSLFNRWSDIRLLGHEYNWAVAGATARAVRNLVTGQNQSELTSDPDFSVYVAFAPEWQQSPARMTTQLQASAEGAVIFVGANDLRFGNSDPSASVGGTPITYDTIYNGDGTGAGNPQPLMDSLRNSVQQIATFVRTGNPAIPLAICAVPHIGFSPEVRSTAPTDPVKTGRVTAALDALNAGLQTWTESTLNAAWVDTYALSKGLIDQQLNIGGVNFLTESDTRTSSDPPGAHNRYLFSHDGFHPTTTLQARVAQMVQAALAAKYPARYAASPPLTDRELIVNVCGIAADTGFREFMAASNVPAGLRNPNDDPDTDSLTNLAEFSLAGFDPAAGNLDNLPQPGFEAPGGVLTATLTWMPRYANNIYSFITCQQSADMSAGSWTDVPEASVTTNANGSRTARVPVPVADSLFLRLKVTAMP